MRYSIFLFFILLSLQSVAQPPAFPGAEGYGMYTTGGRGGCVIKVTNLNDSGEGSLRAAVSSMGARTVVFEVSGIIELESDLIVYQPYLTIAGQTAPGDGICIKNYPLRFKDTHDVIVRFLRIRPGIGSGREVDAIEIRRSKNIIIDHVSAGWSIDEIINTSHDCEDLSVQWCLFSESLNNSIHSKGEHGYAASIGSVRTSYHKNLFAHNNGRNPSISGDDENRTEHMNFSNNVIFNYTSRAMDGKPHSINVLNNYYKPGPSTGELLRSKVIRIDNSFNKYGYHGKWFIEGNYLYGKSYPIDANWENIVRFQSGVSIDSCKVNEPFADADYQLIDAEKIFDVVIDYAGASFPVRDTLDRRAANDTRLGQVSIGNGIIDKVEEAGGWPKYETYDVLTDTDNDGMPDNWENENGLNPNSMDDANDYTLSSDYTNIEVYINDLVSHITTGQQGKEPVNDPIIKDNYGDVIIRFNQNTKQLMLKSDSDLKKIEVYAITGAKLYSKNLNQKEVSIPLHFLNWGGYIVRINGGKNKIQTQKIFVYK